jgi:hypothetical protein
VEFSSLHHSHKLSCSWLLGVPLLLLELLQAWLVYLQFQEGFLSPPLQSSGHPTLFAMCLSCSYCLLVSFSFFPPGGGWSVQGAMLLWPRLVCGSTVVPRSSACPRLPKPFWHAPAHFYEGFFKIRFHKLFAWAGFKLQSSWSLLPE